MPYAYFHNKFPKIAHDETRSFAIGEEASPAFQPDGFEFGLLEMYCNEPGCDCRRVIFDVVSQSQNKSVAYIGYGWENDKYYAKLWSFVDADDIREIQGPALNSMSPQSDIAPELLAYVTHLLEDEAYVERLKRHYALYRKDIDKPSRTKPKKYKKKKQRKR